MSKEIEIDGKTYRVGMFDAGNGPVDYVDVKVATPQAIITSFVWRAVPRDGKTWKRVMAKAKAIT